MSSESAKSASTENAAGAWRSWPRLGAVALQVGILLLCLAGIELFLRVADFRQLRVMPAEFRYPYQHDPELGWVPTPNAVGSHGVRINSLGLRDLELEPSAKPTILFIGDSFVYGAGVKDGERFTDRLRNELPDFRIVNAGVAAYGTDQEYLWLRRLWPSLQPSVVVLIVCVDNDHRDNATNSMHSHTLKPYLVEKDGGWHFAGIPVPRGPSWYYYNNSLAERSALVRLGILIYLRLRYPPVVVPDPTTRLVGMMRDYVESYGARFLVGLQLPDPALEPYLIAEKVPYVRMDGAETLPNDGHWSPRGHITVANRLVALLIAEKALAARTPAQ
jgi:hypothetical protein